MILSQEFTRIYNEIRLLAQASMWQAAYDALPELEAVAVTNGQIAICFALEDVIAEQLDKPEQEA